MSGREVVFGVDVGGTGIECAVVDVSREEIVGKVFEFSTSEMSSNGQLLEKLSDANKDNLPYGVCAPGKTVGLKVDCPNVGWRYIDFSALDRVNVENDLGGASYSLEHRLAEKGVKAFSLWTISTGANGHTVIKGDHIDHELGHQDYVPHGITLPIGFKMPQCNCQRGIALDNYTPHLEVGFSAGGGERMARAYFMNLEGDLIAKDPLMLSALQRHNKKNETKPEVKTYNASDLTDKSVREEVLKSLHAGMIYDLAREYPNGWPQGFIVPIQIQSLAQTIGNYLGHFTNVEEIYFMGSQGINNFNDQVMPAVKKCIFEGMFHPAIKMPKIARLNDPYPGIIGSAIAFAVKNGMIAHPDYS